MNTSNLGNIGEAKALFKFSTLGIPVYRPAGDGYTSDMIAEFNGKLNRIQVKTTEHLHEGSYMEFRITRQDGFHGTRAKYSANDIDYFILYCVETDILMMVPFEEAQTNTLKIRLDSYEGIRKTGMRFVSDYTFDRYINS